MGMPRSPKGRTIRTNEVLKHDYPSVKCALNHKNAFQLLVATILSAQCTDKRVNMVTPALFRKYPSPAKLASANFDELSELVHTTGFYKSKARNLTGMAQLLVSDFGGKVPSEMEDLVRLAGVGRKTANVVRSVTMGLPGLPVDTHVGRLSRRLGLTIETDPVKVETELGKFLPPQEWGDFSLRLIQHGREVCSARKPKCEECALNGYCPSAFKV